MPRNGHKLLATLACALLLQACYEEEEATVEVLQLTPARMDLSGQRIAVLPFAGLGGEVLTERLRTHLASRGFAVAAATPRGDEPADAYHAVEDIVEVAQSLGADLLFEGGTADIDVLEEITHHHDPHTRLTTYDRTIELVLTGQAQLRDARGGTRHKLHLNASHKPRVASSVRVNGRPPHDAASIEELLGPFDALGYLHLQLQDFVEVLRQETQPTLRRAAWILFQSPSLPDSLRAVDYARAMQWGKAAAIYERELPRLDGREARAMGQYNLGVAQVMQGLHVQAAKNLSAAGHLTRKQRLRSLCDEALADNEMLLKAGEQAKTLGFTWED